MVAFQITEMKAWTIQQMVSVQYAISHVFDKKFKLDSYFIYIIKTNSDRTLPMK